MAESEEISRIDRAGADVQAPSAWRTLIRWFDASVEPESGRDPDRIDWLRALPFIAMHVACVGVFWVGISPVALAIALALYCVRMFAITAFYHRYFAHKTFRTSRAIQFVFAAIASSSAQRGPLWWAAHHRNHHRHADTGQDLHSPSRGFWRSHVGWFLTRRGFRTDWNVIPDFGRFPELRFLDRFDIVAPAALAVCLYLTGHGLEQSHPGLHTSGAQLLIWGFFVSTVVLFHATFTINSLAHTFGHRRYTTRDTSRKNWWLAVITFGEGWHNNHHFFPGSAQQGFLWWEVDLTYYLLRTLSTLGIVRDIKTVPVWVRAQATE